MAHERLTRDRLLDEAVAAAGTDDLGEETWQAGLDVLLDGLADEAQLHEIGVEVAASEVVAYLANRLGVVAWAAAHPEVSAAPIERPIFIVGQPRTGTTILHDVLAQDPAFRAPLTWEIDRPVPPPVPSTHRTDPRIDEVQATIEMTDVLIPGFTTFHPMGARLAQECVRITGSDFRSMIFPIQYRVPTYDRWLLHEADLAPAYRWHRRFLQHLQSQVPTECWLLKSPAHLWHLDELAAEYPDAVIVQTHRDPLKVIASTSALATHLRRMTTDAPDITEIAAHYAEDIFLGLERGMDARARSVIPPERIVDVHFLDFVADPIATVRQIYGAMGRDLSGDVEEAMRSFLARNPGDGGGGGTRYRFADTELDEPVLRERSAAYQASFGVVSEPVL